MTGNTNPRGPQPAPVKWYYVDGGSAVGPVDASGLRGAAQAGKLRMDTLVWRSGFDAWKRVDGVPMVRAILNSVRPHRTDEPDGQGDAASAVEAPSDPRITRSSEDLQDALSEEEALERPLDVDQARELLDRVSHHSSIRWTASASLPAAPQVSVTTSPTRHRLPLWIAAFTVPFVTAAASWWGVRSSGPDPAPVAHAQPAAAPTSVGQSEPPIVSVSSLAPERAPVSILEGPLAEEVFAQKLRHDVPMFDQQCWWRLRAAEGKVDADPSLSVTISVGPWGYIGQLDSSEAPAGYYRVDRCIIGRMRGWRFPRSGGVTRAVLRVVPSGG